MPALPKHASTLPVSLPRHIPLGTPINSASLSPTSLGHLLQPSHRALRARMFELFREDVFRARYGEALRSERERTMARIARLGAEGLFVGTVLPGRGKGVAEVNERYEVVMGCVALLDHSLEIKLGVSLGLFGSTVRALGTEEQWGRWLGRIERLEDLGCFALTELGHGSNARGIETVALWDGARGCFVLDTPCESAQKYWIGGAAESATVCAVFAQLIVGGENVGVHAFVVNLRESPGGKTLRGITVADCGVKNGLNGVDNGRIWFEKVEVPRENLLARTCGMSENGVYRSEYKTPDARFGAALAALTGGRVGIGCNSVNAAKIGLAIAVRYTSTRRAFAPAVGEPEVPLLSYSSIQKRLMVPLASSYVYSMCGDDLRAMWSSCLETGRVTKEMHVLSSGFKAVFTWFMSDALQNAREACGGQGYKSENKIGLLRADRDISLTFEGANDVLMQQVAKECLTEFSRTGKLLNASSPPPEGVDPTDPTSALSLPVTDTNFLYHVLRTRERKLLHSLAAQLSLLTKSQHMTPFAAWNASLPASSAVAHAHVQRRMFDMHHAGHIPRAARVGAEVEAAARLCGELHFLSGIDADGAVLRLECLDARKAREVHAAVQGLCAKVAEVAGVLVEGFEIPPHLLAPIAFDFVAHNSRARL